MAEPEPKADKEEKEEKSRFSLKFAAIFVTVVALLHSLRAFEGLDDRWIDTLYYLRGMEDGDPRVIVVAIDDGSVERVGQYPWPRRTYKQLLTNLYKNGVSVVGFDVLFLDPSRPEEDKALIDATRSAGDKLVHSISIDQIEQVHNKFRYPFPALDKASRLKGIVQQPFIDSDGSVRVVPLVVGMVEKRDARAWMDDPGRQPAFGTVLYSRFTGVSVDELLKRGNQVRLNIRGEREEEGRGSFVDEKGRTVQARVTRYGFRRIPAWEVLQDSLSEGDRQALKGSITLVGSTTQGAYDHFPTPFSELTPGVEVHANLIDNLLQERWLRLPSQWVTFILIALMAGAAFGIMKLHPYAASVTFVAVFLGWAALTFAAFLQRWVLDFTPPALTLAGTFGVLMVRRALDEAKGRQDVRKMFGQYVAPEFVEVLIKDRSKLRLGGEKRDMTIFFLDIQHFTNISEKMDPEDLIHFLNHYLTGLSEVILEKKGVVDKYIGDCIMAFWNAPLDVPDHRAQGCLSVVECFAAIPHLNETYKGPKLSEPVAIRIGLNSGTVTVGNTGSTRKQAYTVIGDEVNLASRLEGANKFFGSDNMASESVFAGARDHVEGRILGSIRVVGKKEAIKVYELLGKKGQLQSHWQAALPRYEKGVELYLKREFEKAKAEFDAVLKALPGDRPAKLYRSVCEDYSAIPPPSDWDGVFNLTAK